MKYSALYEYIIPYRNILIISVFLMIAESLVLLLNPWLAGQLTASLLNIPMFLNFSYYEIILIWLVVLLIQALLNFINRFLTSITGERIVSNMKTRLYDHIQSLPLSYFHEHKRGAITSILINDVEILSYFFTSILLPVVPQLFILCGSIIIIIFIDPTIALVIVILVPIFYFLLKILVRKIRPITKKMLDEYDNILAIIEENIHLMPVIKSFTRENYESKRFNDSNKNLLKLTETYLKKQTLLSPLINYFAAALILLLLWISSSRVESGQISIAELVSLLFYGFLLARVTSALADFYGQVQRIQSVSERLNELLNVQPEPIYSGNKELIDIHRNIKFINITFAYPGREKSLCNLDLTINIGETIAITGENGSGKSTLLYLLQRFADPDEGNILIDDVNINTLNITSLRRQIGIVPQNVLLLNGSIYENITYGLPNADRSAVEKAATQAHAHDFILKLPDGYETKIGDEGIKLSGGQKQRIALARALLKEPAILALDEATAMFDPDGEKSFIKECNKILHQRTVILITHRPASLAIADRVLKLENGKIYAS